MSLLTWLVLVALGMGLTGLLAFLWSMDSGQLDDLDGAAERVLLHKTNDIPLTEIKYSPDKSGEKTKGM